MICPECGKEVVGRRKGAKYCLKECQKRAKDRRRDKRMYAVKNQRNAERCKRYKEKLASMGLCVRCGKFVPADGNRVCSTCIESIGHYKAY